MLTVQEFASKIRTKYNAYEDIDDKTLVDKIISKYPVYKDSISFEEPTPVGKQDYLQTPTVAPMAPPPVPPEAPIPEPTPIVPTPVPQPTSSIAPTLRTVMETPKEPGVKGYLKRSLVEIPGAVATDVLSLPRRAVAEVTGSGDITDVNAQLPIVKDMPENTELQRHIKANVSGLTDPVNLVGIGIGNKVVKAIAPVSEAAEQVVKYGATIGPEIAKRAKQLASIVKKAQKEYDRNPTLTNRAMLDDAIKREAINNNKKVLTDKPLEYTLADDDIADITGVPVETIKQNRQPHLDNVTRLSDEELQANKLEVDLDPNTGEFVAYDKATFARQRAEREELVKRQVADDASALARKIEERAASQPVLPRSGEPSGDEVRIGGGAGTKVQPATGGVAPDAVNSSIKLARDNNVKFDGIQEGADGEHLLQFTTQDGATFYVDKPENFKTQLDEVTNRFKAPEEPSPEITAMRAAQQPPVEPPQPELPNVQKEVPPITEQAPVVPKPVEPTPQPVQAPITPTPEIPPKAVEAPPIEPPKPPVEAPNVVEAPSPDQTPLSFVETAKEKGVLSQDVETPLAPVQHHEETSAKAQQIIAEKGKEGTETWLLTETKPSAEYTAVAGATIKRLQDEADAVRTTNPTEFAQKQERATEIALNVANKLREAGRTIEAVKIIGSMSPEGVLIRAQKILSQTNEKLIKKGPFKQKPEKLTPNQADALTTLAKKTQDWGVLSDESKRLAGMIEKVGKGETLNPEEMSQLRDYTKKIVALVGEKYAPKKAREGTLSAVLNARIDKMAQKSLDYFKAQGKTIKLGAGLPGDDMYHASVIGVAFMAKKAIKYADWAAKMTSAIGEEIAPHLKKIYPKSMQMYRTEKARALKTYQQAHMMNNLLKKVEQNPTVAEHPNAQAFADMAANVKRLSGDAQEEAAMELQHQLSLLEKPSTLRKIATAQTIAQLLNLKTQARNILGNEMFYRTERLNKYLASGIDFARSKLTGTDRTVTWRNGEQGNFWESFFKGAKAGWKGFSPEGLQTQYALTGQAFRGKYNPITYLEKALGATMRGFDYAAYARAKGNVLGEMAELDIINKKLNLTPEQKKSHIDNFIGNMEDAEKDIADKYGKYVTFQDDNAISKFFVGMKRLLNVGKEFGIGDFILKYPKTPANLIARFVDYSPIGIGNQLMQMASPFVSKGKLPPTTREITEALTRGITGTMGMTALGYALLESGALQKGAVSGKGTMDRDVREMQQQQTGERPYSVNINAISRFGKSIAQGKPNTELLRKQEGDIFASYDWALPISMNAALTTDVVKSLQEKGSVAKNLGETAYGAAGSALTTVAEQPLLTGLQTLFGDRYEKDQVKRVAKVFEGVPASFVPALSNQLRMMTDKTKREISDPNPFKKAINMAINKVPIWSETLPEAYKALSEPLTPEQIQAMRASGKEGGIEKANEVVRQAVPTKKFSNIEDQASQAFNIFLNPAIVSKYHVDPLVSALLAPYEAEGRDKQFPRVANRVYEVPASMFNRLGFKRVEGRTRIDLPGEKIQEMQRYMAVRTRQMLSRTELGDLKDKSPEQQEKILMNKVSDAAELAKKDFEKRNMKFIYDALKAADREVKTEKNVPENIPLEKKTEEKLPVGVI